MNILELLGTLVGLVYLYLEYKANIFLWVVGIIMPAIYLVVYFQAGLYADFGIQIYYLLAAVYGWAFWRLNSTKNKADLPISYMPVRFVMPAFLTFASSLLIIAWILAKYTNSTVVWTDSFTTALSIVGLWMLAKKYVEQWIAWIAVDAVSSVLYIYKELYFTSALYALYTVIAVFGYFAWRKKIYSDG